MITSHGASSVLEGSRNAASLKSEPVPASGSRPATKFAAVLQESARQQDQGIARNNASRDERQTTTLAPSTPPSRSAEERKTTRTADSSPAPDRSGEEREPTDAADVADVADVAERAESAEGAKANGTERSAAPKVPAKSPNVGDDAPSEKSTEIDGSLAWTSAVNDPEGGSDRPLGLASILTGPQDHEKLPGTANDEPHAASTTPDLYPVALQTAAPVPAEAALQASPQKLLLDSANVKSGPLAERPAGAAATDPVVGTTITPPASDLAALPGWLQQFNKAAGLNADPQTPAGPLAGLVAAPAGPSHTLTAGPLAPTTPLHAAPGSPEFPQQLGVEVMLMARDGVGRAVLTLNPADLGPIQIDLKMHAQVVDLSFAVAHGATREAITQSLPKLGEMLAAQGLSLGSSHVGGESAGHGASTSQQDPRSPAGNGWPPHESGRGVGHAMDRRSLVALTASARGGIDLYA